MARRLFQLIVALMAAIIPLAVFVAPARADDLGVFLSQVNALRLVHGLPGLAVDAALTNDAQAWSQHMASTGVFGDDPNLAADVGGGWTRLGENSAFGTQFAILFNLLVNSPPHLANMLGGYTLTGIGEVVTPSGTWLTQIFETPRAAAAPRPVVVPATTAPRPPPTTRVVTPAHSAARVAAPPATAAAPATTPAPAPTSTSTSTTSTTAAPPPPSVPSTVAYAGKRVATPSYTAAPGVPVPVVAVSSAPAPGGWLRDWVLAASLTAVAMIAVARGLASRRM